MALIAGASMLMEDASINAPLVDQICLVSILSYWKKSIFDKPPFDAFYHGVSNNHETGIHMIKERERERSNEFAREHLGS